MQLIWILKIYWTGLDSAGLEYGSLSQCFVVVVCLVGRFQRFGEPYCLTLQARSTLHQSTSLHDAKAQKNLIISSLYRFDNLKIPHGDEPLGSLEGGKFLGNLSDHELLKDVSG